LLPAAAVEGPLGGRAAAGLWCRAGCVATVCNNCDASIQYIQEHYFHYDAKRATGALATGRKGLKAATGCD